MQGPLDERGVPLLPLDFDNRESILSRLNPAWDALQAEPNPLTIGDVVKHLDGEWYDLNSNAWRVAKTYAELVPRPWRSYFQHLILRIDSRRNEQQRSNKEQRTRAQAPSSVAADAIGGPSSSGSVVAHIPLTHRGMASRPSGPSPMVIDHGSRGSAHAPPPVVVAPPALEHLGPFSEPDSDAESVIDDWPPPPMPADAPLPVSLASQARAATPESLVAWRWVLAMAPSSYTLRRIYFKLVFETFRETGRFKRFMNDTSDFSPARSRSFPVYDHGEYGAQSRGWDVEEYFLQHFAIAGFTTEWARHLERWFRGTTEYSSAFDEWIASTRLEGESDPLAVELHEGASTESSDATMADAPTASDAVTSIDPVLPDENV